MEDPSFITLDANLFKATPVSDGGERFIYFEASNEGVDRQGERVLAKALAESASLYLQNGNVDLDHLSLLRRGTREGVEAEIGFPVAVDIGDSRSFVKAQLFSGTGDLAKNANMVWSSLTELSPPKRWYPSIGGSTLVKSQEVDPETNRPVTVIQKVRWTNVALASAQINQHLGAASVNPVGTFCKSLNCFVLDKALEASYSTDSASLTGGGALRAQSLDGDHDYDDFKEHVSRHLGRIKKKKVLAGRDGNFADVKVLKSIADFASASLGLNPSEAMAMTARFMSDLFVSIRSQSRLPAENASR